MSDAGLEVVLCQTGLGRHAPGLREELGGVGARVSLVECFDRCETCELFLLARVDGAMVRFRSGAELLDAVQQLSAAE